MNDNRPNLRVIGQKRIVLMHILLGGAATGLFFLMGEMGTARNAVGRVQCQQNLKKLYPLILQHVALRGELPVDAAGNLAVSKLAMGNDEDRQSTSDLVACCGDSIDSCYLWRVNVSLGANGVFDESSRQVIAYDRPGNHLQRLGNGLFQRKDGVLQEEAQLLLADGWVITWRGDSPAYAAWAKRYTSGSGEPYPQGIEQRVLGDRDDPNLLRTEIPGAEAKAKSRRTVSPPATRPIQSR